MVWQYHGKAIPLEVYHGVPHGWYAHEIRVEHAHLGGTFDLSAPESTNGVHLTWMPERRAWLDYRATLYRVADGLKAGDRACAELAVRYVVWRYIGSYSGFVRSRLARGLKHVELSPDQKQRLHNHFCALVSTEDRSDEFQDYLGLWRRIISPDQKETLFESMSHKNSEAMAWLVRALQA
jgi:hypothetical protein